MSYRIPRNEKPDKFHGEIMKDFESDNPSARRGAAFALAKLYDRRAVPELIACLLDADADHRSSAAKLLGQLKDERAVEPLIKALADNEWGWRDEAAAALGKIGDSRALPALGHALINDKLEQARYKAGKALGQIGDTGAVDLLMQALSDPVWMVRSYSLEALNELGETRAADEIRPLLDDPHPCVREKAVGVLSNLGDSKVIQPLIDILLREGESTALREITVYALEKFTDARVSAVLEKIAASDTDLKRIARFVLGRQQKHDDKTA